MNGPFILSGVLLWSIVAAFVVGLVGRPRASRPRCRACRHALITAAVLPPICPACGADLTAKRAIRFGGHRIRWRPLAIAAALVAIATLPTLVRGFAAPPPRFVNGVQIESGVGATRFADATAARDENAWAWIAAHLMDDALADGLRERARAMVIEEFQRGTEHVELLLAMNQVVNDDDFAAVAEAVLTAVPTPTITVTRQRAGIVVQLDWPARPQWQEIVLRRAVAIERFRVDGVEVRPSTPQRRFLTELATTQHWLSAAGSASPQAWPAAESTPTVEIALVWAILVRPSEELLRWRLPGPVDQWQSVAAMRRVTIEVPLP